MISLYFTIQAYLSVELSAQKRYSGVEPFPGTRLLMLSPLEKSGKSEGIWCDLESGHPETTKWRYPFSFERSMSITLAADFGSRCEDRILCIPYEL